MSDEPRMTGMDKEIFNATRTLTSLLNDACNHWNYLCPYLEKLAGVADDALRGYQKDYPEQVAELIDYRRECKQQGNAAAMREALLAIKEVADRDMRHHVSMSESDQTSIRAWANLFVSLVDSALAEPPRNCDVGTPYEQANRMRQFCEKQKRNGIINCGYCPIKHQYQRDCTLSWAQMPYEAQKGGAK